MACQKNRWPTRTALVHDDGILRQKGGNGLACRRGSQSTMRYFWMFATVCWRNSRCLERIGQLRKRKRSIFFGCSEYMNLAVGRVQAARLARISKETHGRRRTHQNHMLELCQFR